MVYKASKIAARNSSSPASRESELTLPQLQRENTYLREQAVSLLLEMFVLRERPDVSLHR
jgi:hypothetical protein